jgi:hypothetical protein
MSNETRYRTFREFYPLYLSEHQNRTSRRLHFIGTSVAAVLLLLTIVTQNGWLALVALVQGGNKAGLG